jgi:hypothetical protein
VAGAAVDIRQGIVDASTQHTLVFDKLLSFVHHREMQLCWWSPAQQVPACAVTGTSCQPQHLRPRWLLRRVPVAFAAPPWLRPLPHLPCSLPCPIKKAWHLSFCSPCCCADQAGVAPDQQGGGWGAAHGVPAGRTHPVCHQGPEQLPQHGAGEWADPTPPGVCPSCTGQTCRVLRCRYAC